MVRGGVVEVLGGLLVGKCPESAIWQAELRPGGLLLGRYALCGYAPGTGLRQPGARYTCAAGARADPASRLCSTSQENPTSTAAYFPGHHLRHAATDIPFREPVVASAFWLTRKLSSAASAAALTGCLPR